MTQEAQATRETTLPAPRLTADIYETAGGEAYVIEIPVAGLKPEEIVIEAESDIVTVSTEPQPNEAESDRRYIQREQSLRPLSRIFEFPVEINTDGLRTTLEHGILKIQVPKAAAGRRRVIRVGQSA
jgi:HSP20 family protein